MKTYISILSVFLLCLSAHTAHAQSVGRDTLANRDTIYPGHSKKTKHIRPPFYYPGKQFFLEGQVTGGVTEAGIRIIGGYRFGQFGLLGLGVGVDGVAWAIQSNVFSQDPYGGTYIPVFVQYSGDILKKRVTPYYSVQAGYAYRHVDPLTNTSYISVTPLNHPEYNYYGGFISRAAFGVKLYARHKVYATWGLIIDEKQASDKYSNYYTNSIGENIRVAYSSSSFMFIPGIEIGVGF